MCLGRRVGNDVHTLRQPQDLKKCYGKIYLQPMLIEEYCSPLPFLLVKSLGQSEGCGATPVPPEPKECSGWDVNMSWSEGKQPLLWFSQHNFIGNKDTERQPLRVWLLNCVDLVQKHFKGINLLIHSLHENTIWSPYVLDFSSVVNDLSSIFASIYVCSILHFDKS